MKVTASHTTRALRAIAYPLLKNAGFDDWTTRKTWRRRAGRIDHVEFRSFNTYFAETCDCTTASVSVWVGVQIPELEIESALRVGACGPLGFRPDEAEMPIRGTIAPSDGLRQSNALNIWNVNSIEDAEAVANDIKHQFQTYALDWLESSFDVSELIIFLKTSVNQEIRSRPNGSRFWVDAGNLDSPNRNKMIAKLAITQGNFALAAEHLERSRWAFNHKTGQRYLYLSPERDAELKMKAEECAAKFHNPRS
ncbi:MAG: hypothetical protein KDE05_11775 [Parvularculaceae bacterium]|nr:hypothetical protein [Parvularculaceae bacterium]